MSQPLRSISIVGAGPVGALLSIMLARQGYHVDLFESRDDPRISGIDQNRSINIALSERGWLALQSVGISEMLKDEAIPLYHRAIHDLEDNLSKQAYGKKNQAIWSISRTQVLKKLLSLVEGEMNISLHFGYQLTHIDIEDMVLTFNTKQGVVKRTTDLLFGADGAFSKVRRNMQEHPQLRISYSLEYMLQSYIELNIPADVDGSYKLDKDSLHIWPRKDFMLIALPNLDGSFTCTLFMNQDGEVSFNSLKKRSDIEAFFQTYFNDVLHLIKCPIEDFMNRNASPLFLVQVYPWVVNNNIALIGDAAHSMVPFYGQGMNCGFEDCRVLNELITKYSHDWLVILSEYQKDRKKNADAISELSKRNFNEMSYLSGKELFQISKKIEQKFQEMHPELWNPLYSMVTFSPDISYSEALRLGGVQNEIMEKVMALPGIKERWKEPEIYKILYELSVSAGLKEGNKSDLSTSCK